MAYEDYTAVELARVLDHVQHGSPEDTGHLSLLDEATLRWSARYRDLVAPQRAFAEARQMQWPATRSAETWRVVVSSAGRLAEALREFDGAVLELCPERTGWGTCNLSLPVDGPCRAAGEHIAGRAEAAPGHAVVPGDQA